MNAQRMMEEKDDGIVLRSGEKGTAKLSWEDTAREMAASGEDWGQLHPHWRSRIQVPCADQQAEIAVDQIRTLSKARLGQKIESLSPEDASTLRRLISEMYGEG